jgi:hypothetical protein
LVGFQYIKVLVFFFSCELEEFFVTDLWFFRGFYPKMFVGPIKARILCLDPLSDIVA